jgi:glycosyltransferase involved in cell wall biosynthesis
MKKILFILPNIPYPLLSGGEQAMYNGLFAVQKDIEAYFVYRSSKRRSQFWEKLIKESKLENVNFLPFYTTLLKKKCYQYIWNRIYHLINLIRGRKESYDYESFCLSNAFSIDPFFESYINFINSCINKYQIDIVQIEMCGCLPYVLALPQQVKKIFVHHELRFVVNDLWIQKIGKTPYRLANLARSKILEIGLLNKYDGVITLSDIDNVKLKHEGVSVPIFSSVAVVNTNERSVSSNDFNNVLSFVGPSTHSPNYIGIKWFLEKCWDKLLQKDASYRLKIVGNWSEDKRCEIRSMYKNIDFAGFVPNLADALNNTIMIVPITVGSGIRMKILEAASLGIPFVSTTVGAEGLPFESGRDCLKGDTPEEFVNAILKMRDKSLRVEFAAKANALVKEKYSMEALRKNRLEIYEKVMKWAKNRNLM